MDPLKAWADNKLGKASAGPAKGPPGAAPTAPVAAPQLANQKPKVPDVRADQMSWLGALEQQELKGKEQDPPPSWIDPMAWEQAKVQVGQEWANLPEPRAAAAFIVHQTQQAAKAAAMPPPGMPAPGAPAAPPGPPVGGPPHPPKPAFGGPR